MVILPPSPPSTILATMVVSDGGGVSSSSSSSSSRRKIPRSFFMTNQYAHLNRDLLDNVGSNREATEGYAFHFFDDEACARFLHVHFERRVLEAFGQLFSGAFRSDLFRYCYLYVHGGVYLDINKRLLVPPDAFIEDHHDMVLVQDQHPEGIYQAFIAIRSRHPLMLRIIDRCVRKVFDRNGAELHSVTGVNTLQEEFRRMYGVPLYEIPSRSEREVIKVLFFRKDNPIVVDPDTDRGIFHSRPICKALFQTLSSKKHYGHSTHRGRNHFMDASVIPYLRKQEKREQDDADADGRRDRHPKRICFTFSTLFFPSSFDPIFRRNTQRIGESWKIDFFEGAGRRRFLQRYFGVKVLGAYDRLVPETYKAELFRYCYLYIHGGMCMDLENELLVPLEQVWSDTEDAVASSSDLLLVVGSKEQRQTIWTGCMASVPRCEFWRVVIDSCVRKIEDRFYGENDQCVTGSDHLQQCFYQCFSSSLKDIITTTNIIGLKNTTLITMHSGESDILHLVSSRGERLRLRILVRKDVVSESVVVVTDTRGRAVLLDHSSFSSSLMNAPNEQNERIEQNLLPFHSPHLSELHRTRKIYRW